MRFAFQNCMTELSFLSNKAYEEPFNEIELDVVFEGDGGKQKTVPGFWAGENVWKVRFSTPIPGKYTYRTVCSDGGNSGLQNQKGEIEVIHYTGKNPLLIHGALRVSENRRYLEHVDGTPFFWLGDTWWMGLCKRFEFEGVQVLACDRVQKGFTVIQIVAGLYPDMPPFDERGANEAGFPWEKDFKQINPSYFDMADLRIDYLVRSSLVPCIVGCWGYFLPLMGVEKMKKHWRYLIARYGAYPVVWCLAGEGIMPYYLSEDKEKDRGLQKKGWTEIASYVRQICPYHPITIHPTDCAHNQIEDVSLIDIDMLQTGHSDRDSIPNNVNKVVESISRVPRMPVLVGEVCYEGILGASRENVQRFLFWASMLSGASGHTYGANGIWQVNTREEPFGLSPHGHSWGNTPWEEAYRLPGSAHLGIAKKLLERYPWWEFEPHPEWIEPHWTEGNYMSCYAAGIPKKVRVIFIPSQVGGGIAVKDIEPDAKYEAFYYDPINGEEYRLGVVKPDDESKFSPPDFPIFQDRVLVLETL